MSFVITRADGSERAVSGYRYAAPRPGSKMFSAKHTLDNGLPPKVDLRGYMTDVEDQGRTNSCVANATAGAYEYLVKRYLGDDAYDVSRLFIYFNARAEQGMESEDEGSMIADAIEGLRKYGACSEATWSFDSQRVNERPGDEAYQEAARFLIEDVENVPTNLEAWKQALAEGNPIIFGVQLFRSFDVHRKPGLVPLPSSKETGRESHGGHAMLCVGYSDPDELFIVRNSWGTSWGDAGYCYVPYRYLMHDRYNGGDSWIIRRVEPLDLDQETWGDESTILPDIDQELASMTEEEFGALIDALGDTPLETRLALLFLNASGADAEISDPEVQSLAQYLETVLRQIGSRLDPAAVVSRALPLLGSQDPVDETIAILGEHLTKAALANIIANLEQVVSADEFHEDEAEFVDSLIQTWQIESGGES